MPINPSKTAQFFLENFNSTQTQNTFDILAKLLESLETKHDPDPTEIRLVQNIYEFVEKLRTMEENIRSYSKEFQNKLPGNKLSSLYEEISNTGNIFRD